MFTYVCNAILINYFASRVNDLKPGGIRLERNTSPAVAAALVQGASRPRDGAEPRTVVMELSRIQSWPHVVHLFSVES